MPWLPWVPRRSAAEYELSPGWLGGKSAPGMKYNSPIPLTNE